MKHAIFPFTHGVSTLAIIAALGAATVPAFAAQAPIEIRSCSPVFVSAENSPYAVGVRVQSGVEIRFVNRAGVAAQEVAFGSSQTPEAAMLVGRGSFAPGVMIRSVFETALDAQSVCRVATIRFADKTVYNGQAAAYTAQASRSHDAI